MNTSVGNALGAGSGANAARAFRAGLTLAVCLQVGLCFGHDVLYNMACMAAACLSHVQTHTFLALGLKEWADAF